MRTVLVLLTLLILAPAVHAQRDTVKLGERLGAVVLKKDRVKTRQVSPEKNPEPLKIKEALGVQRKEPIKLRQ